MADILQLPDELIEAIVLHLSPADTTAFAAASKHCRQIADQQHVWRRHCLQGWQFWNEEHELEKKQALPLDQGAWRELYQHRFRTDIQAQRTFDSLLTTQQHRCARMEAIAQQGYNIKDLLLSLRDQTPDSTPDALARRYHANAILGQVHRAIALQKWSRLQNQQMIRLEEVLGAYDLFVLPGPHGDLHDLDRELDRLAHRIRLRDDAFDARSTRSKAIQIIRFLRAERLVGNPDETEFHALRNNFLSFALLHEPHSSLPLQSVAIFCAVARRLGVNAKPSNFPHHVHAIILSPPGFSLDGKPLPPSPHPEPETMHLDPWRSDTEIPIPILRERLSQMGVVSSQHDHLLAPSSTFDAALRTSRNILYSVREARERRRALFTGAPSVPDIESAWYCMLWSMLVLGDNSSDLTLRRRKECLPHLMEHLRAHFPEDIGLAETYVLPMFRNEPEHAPLADILAHDRVRDATRKAPKPRSTQAAKDDVKFKVGQVFRHKRYTYEGVVTGWDLHCSESSQWIQQMAVDRLQRGRMQPFYHVVAEDRTARYVAEDNIQPFAPGETPCAAVMLFAGKYFLRWDPEGQRFVSNLREEFPDD